MKTWQALCLAVGLYGALFIATAEEQDTKSNGQRLLHKCEDDHVLEEKYRNNISAFPADCRYYCNRSSDATEIWYGYYKVYTPCTNSTDLFDEKRQIKHGICITSGVTGQKTWKCDLTQPSKIKLESC
uniref:Putative conserved secreted protein n=1 Tax=Ornithodoros turicata TaxID=34597 RepID=A0A2R5L4F2_9ACAR